MINPDYYLDYKVGKAYTDFDFDRFIRFNSRTEYKEAICLLGSMGIPFATLGGAFMKVFVRTEDLLIVEKAFEKH